MVDPFFRTDTATLGAGVQYDAGLRAHMQRVFNYMAGGVGISGVVAFLVGSNPALAHLVFGTPLAFVAMFAPLVFLMFGMNFQNVSFAGAQTRFWIFSGLMGLSLGWIGLAYAHASIARAFFVAAGTFGTMSLWGYTTRRDLTSMGAFMMMGLFGLLIAGVVNFFFLQSTAMQWVTTVASVIIFTGLTAYDVQKIKQSYAESYGTEANGKMAVYGALQLYLDFINLFISLLRLFGDRR